MKTTSPANLAHISSPYMHSRQCHPSLTPPPLDTVDMFWTRAKCTHPYHITQAPFRSRKPYKFHAARPKRRTLHSSEHVLCISPSAVAPIHNYQSHTRFLKVLAICTVCNVAHGHPQNSLPEATTDNILYKASSPKNGLIFPK